MRQLLDWQREAGDPGEFLDNLRYEMASSEIFVFTPKGDIHTLPAGSTPVDFAYSVHTEVGNRCIGAKVDGRLVALETQADQRPDRRDLHLQGGRTPGRAGTGCRSSRRRGRRPRSGSTSPRNGARRRSRSARTRSPRPIRREGLPVQRLISPARAVRGGARPGLQGHRRAVRGGRREPRLGENRGRPRWSRCSAGPSEAGEEIAERLAGAIAAAAAAATGRRRAGQGRRRHPGQAGPVLHPGARATRSSASSPRAARSRCTGWTAPTPTSLRSRAAAAGRRSLGSELGVGVPGVDPGRGAGPAPAALRHHQDAGGREGQHPVGQPVHEQGPDGDQPVLLRDGRPASTWATCCARCARSRASTTSTG